MSSPAPLKPDDVAEGMLVLVTGSNPEVRGTVVKKEGMRVSVEVVTVANGETRKQKRWFQCSELCAQAAAAAAPAPAPTPSAVGAADHVDQTVATPRKPRPSMPASPVESPDKAVGRGACWKDGLQCKANLTPINRQSNYVECVLPLPS
jgi:hypothetical protein